MNSIYYSIPRKFLWKATEMANISKPVINLLKLIYKTNTGKINKESKISEEFRPNKGLLQRCCMSPTLFKIYMNIALKEWAKK